MRDELTPRRALVREVTRPMAAWTVPNVPAWDSVAHWPTRVWRLDGEASDAQQGLCELVEVVAVEVPRPLGGALAHGANPPGGQGLDAHHCAK